MLTGKSLKRQQYGYTVAMLAVFIIGLFAMAALAIDLGVLYTARTSAQHAADAAALAGAWSFMDPTAVQPVAAQEAAIATAGANYVLGRQVVISAADVDVNPLTRIVTVTVTLDGADSIGTFFARAINVKSVDVAVQASAEAAVPGSPEGTRCLKPLYIPTTILSTLQPQPACDAGEVLFDADGNLTPWALAQQALHNEFTIKPGDPADALTSSQFYALDFGSGAADYRCTLGYCINVCGVSDTIECGDAFPVKTGNMIGPTNQGVDDLTGNDPDLWIWDVQPTSWHYETQAGQEIQSTAQVVMAPVWDFCTSPISPGYNGQTVAVMGFAKIFIGGMQGKDVKMRLISATGCVDSGGSGGGSGTPTDTFGQPERPVRLVQTPASP